MTRLEELADGMADVRARIDAACSAAGRDAAEVQLVAVTKTWPASDCALLQELGVLDLGENRDAEAAEKAALLPGVRWHFVGEVQSRKARSVAAYATVVHSVDRLKLVDALARGAEQAGRVVGVLLQVSLDGDPQRGGARADAVPALADAVAGHASLALQGVMAVAPREVDPGLAFAELAGVAARLRDGHPQATVVSAGMSGDLEQAVAHGATLVRVGTALLGPRSRPLR